MSASSAASEVQFPEWSQFLFRPYRWKVAHGGRGSGKSWAFARALIVASLSQSLRVLCAREVQKNIKESVHRLLSDQIEAMGFGHLFEVLETEIRGRNGSLFFFAGLSNTTADGLKSFEGCDICWVEEAHSITQRSWNILIPTIRKPDSEIWVTFNPVLDTDETWKRLVETKPPNSYVVQVNHSDNPWFPEVLEQERIHARDTMAREDYDNIWEGKCRSAAEGAIYSHEVQAAYTEERVRPVPYDPRLKVHSVWDMGWNDAMTIILVQRGLAELRIIGYIEESHKTLDWYCAELNKLNYNWGQDWLPHDAYAGDYKTGKSAAEIIKRFKRNPRKIPGMTVEQGIKAARMAFPRCYFDKVKTTRLMECLKRYRRGINSKTEEAGNPVHDEFSHGADAFRYLGVVADMLRNEEEDPTSYSYEFQPHDSGLGY